MGHEQDMGRLESFVENLLGSHNELKQEYDRLVLRLQESEQENKELRGQIDNLSDDRNVMRGRVTGLISRIETWEKSNNGSSGRLSSSDSDKGTDALEDVMPIFSTGVVQKTEPAIG